MISKSVRQIAVPSEVKPLIDAIRRRLHPDSIWLFGSRARGDDRSDSDWDILVALPDDAATDLLDPIVGWEIQHEVGIPATVLTARASDLIEMWGAPNTLGYDLAKDGQLLVG